jgi:hypothetical protein
VVALSKAARVFDLPVVLSTVETKSFSGNLWPQIRAVFLKQVLYKGMSREISRGSVLTDFSLGIQPD